MQRPHPLSDTKAVLSLFSNGVQERFRVHSCSRVLGGEEPWKLRAWCLDGTRRVLGIRLPRLHPVQIQRYTAAKIDVGT